MEIVRTLSCDGCGASVPVFGKEQSVCNYCGSRMQADDQVEQAREMVENAEAIEAAGLNALQFALYRSGVGGSLTGVFFAFVIFVPAIALIFIEGFLAAFAWFVGSAALIAVVNNLRAHKNASGAVHAEQKKLALMQAFQTGELETACPQCGSLVSMPSLNCAFSCANCDGWLLAAEGLLIARVDDAQAIRMAFIQRAQGILKAYHLKFQEDSTRQHDAIMFGVIGIVLLLFIFGVMQVL